MFTRTMVVASLAVVVLLALSPPAGAQPAPVPPGFGNPIGCVSIFGPTGMFGQYDIFGPLGLFGYNGLFGPQAVFFPNVVISGWW